MKFTIEQEKEKFKPIDLKIRIESREELVELWHRFNIGFISVQPGYYGGMSSGRNLGRFPSCDKFLCVWKEINSLIEEIDS